MSDETIALIACWAPITVIWIDVIVSFRWDKLRDKMRGRR